MKTESANCRTQFSATSSPSSLLNSPSAPALFLSTRWKSLWVLLPDLELEMPRKNLNLDSEDATFINFVDKILTLRNSLPIRKFLLSCSLITVDFDRLYDIICTAVNCHVARLDLLFREAMDKVRLPWNPLMNCKTLVELKLGKLFVIEVPTSVSFPTLKCLHLESLIYSDNASFERLICGCPVLEELYVRRLMDYLSGTFRADNVTRLNVSVPSLKRLKVQNVNGDDRAHELLVDAPNLEYLYVYDLLSENYVFKNLSSVVESC